MKIKPTKIHDKFEHDMCNTDIDLEEAMMRHFKQPLTEDESIGVFNLTRKCARWLLRNCTYSIPEGEAKAESVYNISQIFAESGAKGCWDEVQSEPIVINTDTHTIEDGSVRLHALALGEAYGVYIPIILQSGVDK